MFSHWENQYYNTEASIAIIGAGIVGLSTALSIVEKNRNQSVIVIDRNFPPRGASTKNAGFICFGSITEILDDLENIPRNDCLEIIKMRWKGSQILLDRMKNHDIELQQDGGFEVFDKNNFPTPQEIQKGNEIFYEAIGIKNYFKETIQNDFDHFNQKSISMDREGQLNPMKMMLSLFQQANEKGIKFIFGHEVNEIKENKIFLGDKKVPLCPQKIVVCTNGFATTLIPDLQITAVRNQVLAAKPKQIPTWKGVFHYDRGYYYWRQIGDGNILLGGARNANPLEETTSKFGTSEEIKNTLTHFLQKHLETDAIDIHTWWSGILGIGESKFPIVKYVSKYVLVGVRLGGMGVAIGSYLGNQLAQKIAEEYDA